MSSVTALPKIIDWLPPRTGFLICESPLAGWWVKWHNGESEWVTPRQQLEKFNGMPRYIKK